MLDIPNEIKIEIFKFCDIQMIYNLMLLCKEFYTIIYDDIFWKYLLNLEFESDNIKFISSITKKHNSKIYKKCSKFHNLSNELMSYSKKYYNYQKLFEVEDLYLHKKEIKKGELKYIYKLQ